MTAGGPNEYGDDSKKNRFVDPDTGEAYFVIVNKKTGKTKIYNEEFGADKYIGEFDPDTGKINYNNNWWGGARKEEKKFFNDNKNLIKNQAKKVITKEKVKEERLSAAEAAKEANTLMGDGNISDAKDNTSANSVDGTAENFETGTKEKAFVYPTTLRRIDNAQDTLKISMIEYRTSGLDTSLGGVGQRSEIKIPKKILGTVILPIPGGIGANNSTEWDQGSMTAMDAAKAEFLLTTGEEGVGKALTGLQDKFDNANLGDLKKGLLAALASGSGKTNDLLSRTTGQVFNPNMELLFKGPSLRDFTFNYKLAPRNEQEGKTVLQIIRFFKQGMAPIRTDGKLFLKTPNIFDLEYTHKGGEHKGLNRFKECALTGCQVGYTPDATYSTFEDGIMTAYDMQLTFKELSPIYNDDYGKNKGSVPQEIGF